MMKVTIARLLIEAEPRPGGSQDGPDAGVAIEGGARAPVRADGGQRRPLTPSLGPLPLGSWITEQPRPA